MRGCREAGVTCAMLLEFGKQLNIAVNVVWHKAKISSFVPESAQGSLALYVHGTHAFFVGDPKTNEAIANMDERRPHVRPDVVQSLAPTEKTDIPPVVGWRDYDTGSPLGYYTAPDLAELRLQLHMSKVVPIVQLSGMGIIKALRIEARSDGAAGAVGHAVVQRAMSECLVYGNLA